MAAETVFVGLGSNLGDSRRTLEQAWKILGDRPGVTALELSPPFKSAPVDMDSHHWFTNAAGRLRCSHDPGLFLALLLEIEHLFGRHRETGTKGYQDRTLDLDLLYFGSHIIDTPQLTIPHPRRAERLFVMAPLAAIAPDYVDPQTAQPIGAMLEELQRLIESGLVPRQEITRVAWEPEIG